MHRFVAATLSSAVVATGLLVAAPAHSSVPTRATAAAAGIQWGACTDPDLQAAGAQCGWVSVPLDYRHPGGSTIKIAVSRVMHTAPAAQYEGVILVNPGGPGGSGLGLATLGQYVPGGVGGRYDWIGFDPRGVGSSEPALSCIPGYMGYDRPYYVPVTRSLETRWLNRSQRYAQACGRDNLALLQHLKTTDVARDMDRIRLALGVSRINYYGFSYGTYLGQVYATMFPGHVRRMVLDSNVDPRRVWYQANLDQDVAFERNIKIWFGWLAKYDSVYHLGTTAQAVERVYYQQIAALRRAPAGGVIGPDELSDVLLYAGYYNSTWPGLGDAFAGLVNQGDWQTMKGWYDAVSGLGNDNGFAVYIGVECTDAQWPQQWSTWRSDNWRVYRKAPFFTWGNAWFNAPCFYWPAKSGTPVKVDGHRVPALLIDETLDAATPYQGSLEVRRRFPHSSLIALPGGTSHANSLFGDVCLDNKIAAYLANGTLPPRKPGSSRADATCAPLPEPVPSELAPATALSSQAAAMAVRATGSAAGTRDQQLFTRF